MEEKRKNGFGIASLVLGIVGISTILLIIGIIPCVISLILGIIALFKKNASKGSAIAGVACSSVAIFLLVAIVWLGSTTDSSSATNNNNSQTEQEQNNTNNNIVATEKESESEVVKKEDEFLIGEIAETKNFKIKLVSCEEWESDNMFINPKDGYVFYRMQFDVENISNSDQYIFSTDFECYADGYVMDMNFYGDDALLSSSMSSGKKTKFSLYFEVPTGTESIVVEYETNYWTDKKITFIGK